MEQKLREFFASRGKEISAAYLFGSQARKEAGPKSDVDVGVLYRDEIAQASPSIRALRLEGELERELAKPVQVVALNRAPVDLIHRVLRDGILVAEHDRSARIRFEIQARNRYFDLLPILRRYRKLKPATP